jgi:hypothetical protein
MGLLQWITGSRNRNLHPGLAAWRASWNRATGSADVTALPALREQLDGLNIPDEEIEIEREMLEALQDLSELVTSVPLSGLPTITTGHRVVGDDRCHLIAPASMPDEASQAAGQLLLTNRRAIFVGGAARTVSWHRVHEVRHQERDLVLLAKQPDTLVRFRCNRFSEAVRAAFIARTLTTMHRRPEAGL